jgi:hypothetical protein
LCNIGFRTFDSSSSSLDETSSSLSVLCSSPPIPNLHILVELSSMTEVPTAEVVGRRTHIEAMTHVAAPKVVTPEGLLPLSFMNFTCRW